MSQAETSFFSRIIDSLKQQGIKRPAEPFSVRATKLSEIPDGEEDTRQSFMVIVTGRL